jgi:hypothetical protein
VDGLPKKIAPLTHVCPTMTGDGDSNQAAKKTRCSISIGPASGMC